MGAIGNFIIYETLTLVGLIIIARIYWRLRSNHDPVLSIVPVKAIKIVKSIPKVLIKADQDKTRSEYVDNNG